MAVYERAQISTLLDRLNETPQPNAFAAGFEPTARRPANVRTNATGNAPASWTASCRPVSPWRARPKCFP